MSNPPLIDGFNNGIECFEVAYGDEDSQIPEGMKRVRVCVSWTHHGFEIYDIPEDVPLEELKTQIEYHDNPHLDRGDVHDLPEYAVESIEEL